MLKIDLKNEQNFNLKATYLAVFQPKKIFGHILQPKNDIFGTKFQPFFAGLSENVLVF